MDQAVGHHPVKRSGDLQIGHHCLQRVYGLLRRRTRLLFGVDQSLRRVHLSLCQDQIVAGDGPGRLGGFGQPLVGTLCRGQLRFCLQPFRFRGLEPGLRFGNLRLHFRRAQRYQQISLLHHAAAVHQNALHVARHFGMQGDHQEGMDFRRQLNGAGHRL